jgi:pyruvate,water dikinase
MRFIKSLTEVGIADISLVGGKNASLGEMLGALGSKGIHVPSGFAITAEGYRYFVEEAGLDRRIRSILSDLDTHDLQGLASRGARVRKAVIESRLPTILEQEIVDAYTAMEEEYGAAVDVAVRSSATAEDLPDASFEPSPTARTRASTISMCICLLACRRWHALIWRVRV